MASLINSLFPHYLVSTLIHGLLPPRSQLWRPGRHHEAQARNAMTASLPSHGLDCSEISSLVHDTHLVLRPAPTHRKALQRQCVLSGAVKASARDRRRHHSLLVRSSARSTLRQPSFSHLQACPPRTSMAVVRVRGLARPAAAVVGPPLGAFDFAGNRRVRCSVPPCCRQPPSSRW